MFGLGTSWLLLDCDVRGLMGAGRPQGTARPSGLSTPSEHVDLSLGCFNGCGENRPQMLRYYQLVRDGKPVGRWRLCGDCFVWGQGPPDPDPRHVSEDAA